MKSKTDSSCMPPTVVNNNLDNNIFGEILIRLPAKTVARLKAINKRWYSFISDPLFVNEHISRQTDRNACSYFSRLSTRGSIYLLSFDNSSSNLLSETTISLDLPKKFDNSSGLIEASCHGLLLVRLGSYICIFNPLTKKKQLISSLFCVSCTSFSHNYGLVFRPTSSSPYNYNHYNVVCLLGSKEMVEFKVFNPETGFWRDSKKATITTSDNEFSKDSELKVSNPVCVRGIIHWLTREGIIIAFNLDKEEIRFIEIPKSIFEMESRWFTPILWRTWFGVVEDELNIVVTNEELEMEIWVLHDYENNKWKFKRKSVVKREMDRRIVYAKPIFFDGVRSVLNVHSFNKIDTWGSYWQEHNIQTGVSGPLCSSNVTLCFPQICTLTEVSDNN